MANYWAGKGHKVTLVTLVAEETPAYELHAEVRLQHLGMARVTSNTVCSLRNISGLRRLRSCIVESYADAVISFIEKVNVTTLLAMFGSRVPVIVSERTDPDLYEIGPFWRAMRALLYPRAARVVVQTEAVRQRFGPRIRKRATVIPNPVVNPPEQVPPPNCRLQKPCVVTMGRLGREKGFDLLMKAFQRAAARHPVWSLLILGEGAGRPELERLRDRLGLAAKIYLPGWEPNPYAVLKRADLFVMSSRFEGFPNALCEAMACGLPVVATDCLGARDIVRNAVNGLIVPREDVDALAEAMDGLMSDAERRRRLGMRAREITGVFSLDAVMDLWGALLRQVSGRDPASEPAVVSF